MPTIESVLEALSSAARQPMSTPPRKNPSVPQTTGIYALWLDETELMYVGIVRLPPDSKRNVQSAGLAGRLHTYYQAPLTEKAVLQIALKFVIPGMGEHDVARLLSNDLEHRELSKRCRDFIRNRILCTTVSVDAETAMAAEAQARRFGLPGSGKPPLLNPDERQAEAEPETAKGSARQPRLGGPPSPVAAEDDWAWEQYRDRYRRRPETFEALVSVWRQGRARTHFSSWSAFSRCVVAEPERARNVPEKVLLAQEIMTDAGYMKSGTGKRPDLVWEKLAPTTNSHP